MTAPATEVRYVPDGDPCPRHGQPTRLMHLPGVGLMSQCRGCREAFLDWFAEHLRGTTAAASADLHPLGEGVKTAPQLELGALG